ncbi:MAG: hypothetical protein GF399_05420 [Candidatus Coatesbacteria bacterium]|nr:hypothetical protein [Candidatus Coatesbacteria bacterium]
MRWMTLMLLVVVLVGLTLAAPVPADNADSGESEVGEATAGGVDAPPPPTFWWSLGSAWAFDFDQMSGVRSATSINFGTGLFHLGLGYAFTYGRLKSCGQINYSDPFCKIGARFITPNKHFILTGVHAGLVQLSSNTSRYKSRTTDFNFGIHCLFRFNVTENTYVHLDIGLDSFLYSRMFAYIGTGFSIRL